MASQTIESSLLMVFRMLIEQDAEIRALRDLLSRLDSEGILDQEAIDQARNSAMLSDRQILQRLQSLESRVLPLQISDILETLEKNYRPN